MNNSFFIVCLLLLICSNYGFGHKDIGTANEKKNGGGQKSLQKVNGIIQAKESSNKIPLECCECLCNGKDISNKGKNTNFNAKRVKRGTCARCGRFAYDNTSLCYYCVQQNYTHTQYEQEAQSSRKCIYINCDNQATRWDKVNDPVCLTHYNSGGNRAGDGEASSSNQNARECEWCNAIATTTDQDGDPACGNHASKSSKNNNRSLPCVYCGRPSVAYHRHTSLPVCASHNF